MSLHKTIESIDRFWWK